jgi:cell division protein FtsN
VQQPKQQQQQQQQHYHTGLAHRGVAPVLSPQHLANSRTTESVATATAAAAAAAVKPHTQVSDKLMLSN